MRVQVLKEVKDPSAKEGQWCLCFQWCNYIYDDPSMGIEQGYRFIFRNQKNHLQPTRGQARIGSIALAEKLMKMAKEEGWGNLQG